MGISWIKHPTHVLSAHLKAWAWFTVRPWRSWSARPQNWGSSWELSAPLLARISPETFSGCSFFFSNDWVTRCKMLFFWECRWIPFSTQVSLLETLTYKYHYAQKKVEILPPCLWKDTHKYHMTSSPADYRLANRNKSTYSSHVCVINFLSCPVM